MTTNWTVPPNFGELVRAERLIRGWSMIDLQNRTGVHVNTISRIERGLTKVPQHRTFILFGHAMGVNFAQVHGETWVAIPTQEQGI